MYGFEWLEDDHFSVNYKIESDTLFVDSFKIQGYDREQMARCYRDLISNTIDCFGLRNAELRIYAMISCDIIANLPFSFKAGGEKRLVALMMLIHAAATQLVSVTNKTTVKGVYYA